MGSDSWRVVNDADVVPDSAMLCHDVDVVSHVSTMLRDVAYLIAVAAAVAVVLVDHDLVHDHEPDDC